MEKQANTSAPSPVHDLIAGGVGGVFNIVSGHPLDTIKVRLQTMGQSSGSQLYRGMMHCGVSIVRHEGILALYKGLSPPLLSAAPINALYFGGFGVGKYLLCKGKDRELTLGELFLAGCFGSFFMDFVLVPAERIKCILQVQNHSRGESGKYAGVSDCARHVVRQEGFLGLYRGFWITLLRDVPSGGAYMYIYFGLMRLMDAENPEKQRWHMLKILFAGGFGGMADWILSIPQDTIKSRMQTAPKGMYPRGARDVLSELLANEGWRTLFRGLTPCMIRAYIANAFCFLGYELTLHWLRSAHKL